MFGGTLNDPGALTIEVTKPYWETVLARVIEQFEQPRPAAGPPQSLKYRRRDRNCASDNSI